MAPALKTMGINVSLIEPGPVDTQFLASEDKGTDNEDNPYSDVMNKMNANRIERFKTAQTPEDIAKVIHEAITAENPHLKYPSDEAMSLWIGREKKDPSGDKFMKDIFTQLGLDKVNLK